MIYTQRNITIKNDTATIDSRILLFRGDREVEIQFTIIDSKFRFKSNNGNIIDSTQASYGQLAIVLPDGTNLFSDVVDTQNGVITFNITGEMIDELHEVGFYSFHIRLYNDDKTSRITLPPVMEGIEIREPLVIDDDTADIAIVGYSTIQTFGTEESAFDENGDYIKTDWRTGDKITASKLNKIEEALETIDNEIPTKTSQLTNDSNFLTSVPSEYITETELNAKGYLTEHQDISNKADKSEIPTKTSQLTNDSNFLTSVPSEYVTDSELNAKGYLTEHQDISNKVDKVDGKGLSTNDYTMEEKNKLAGIEAGANNIQVWTAKECTTFTSDSGTCTPLAVQKAVGMFPPKEHEHSQYLTEHQDISGKLNANLGAENAGKILSIGNDGSIILIDMPSGDIVGIVDDNNNIILNGYLAEGTYTIKYQYEDGTYSSPISITIGNYVPEPEPVEGNLFNLETTTVNARFSGSSIKVVTQNGVWLTDFIPFDINIYRTLYVKNAIMKRDVSSQPGPSVIFFDENKDFLSILYCTPALTNYNNWAYKISDDYYKVDFNVSEIIGQSYWNDVKYIRVSGVESEAGNVIDKNDIEDVIITINEPIGTTAVNLIPTAMTENLDGIFNSVGYQENLRWSGTNQDFVSATDCVLTGLIPIGDDGDVFHIRGVDMVGYVDGRQSGWAHFYDSEGNRLQMAVSIKSASTGTDTNGDFTINMDHSLYSVPTGAAYVRFQIGAKTGELIIMRNILIP